MRFVDITGTNTMTVLPHELAREKGNGSREEADDVYEDAAYRHDERADTETTFFERDIDSLNVSAARKRELRRMLRRQEGENQGEAYYADRQDRKQQNRGEWKRRLVQVYASHLGVTNYQRERARHLVEGLDFSSFGSYTKEQCILGVLNVVAREDGRFIEDEEPFRELMRSEGVTARGMRNVRKLLRQRL